MGIAAGDVDEDGDEDLFVTNLIGETHVLYLNDGRGNFEDARATSGVAGPTGPMTGFGTNWIDYDNDGRLDLLLVNGAVNIVERQRGSASPYRQRRLLLHQDAPLKFTDVSLMAGPAFADGEIGRGAAFGDLDDDGDVDVVVTNNDGPVRLLRNQTAAHGAVVGLADPWPNRHGIGALVEGWTKSGERLRRRVRADGSYLSANDTRVHFGFGDTPGLARLQVRWPDGGCERWSAVPDGAVITFVRGTGVSSAGPCEGGAPR